MRTHATGMTMRLVSTPPEEAAAFAERVRPFLLAREVGHCLMIGLLATPVGPADGAYQPPRRVSIEDGGEVVGVAVQTRRLAMAVTRLPPGGVELLVDYLGRSSWEGRGFTGPVEAVDALAACWTRRFGTPMRVKTALRLFEAREVVPPAPALGEMIPAADEHLDVLTAWRDAFARYVGEPDPDPREGARRMIESGNGYLWRDGAEIRSVAAVAGPTPSGIRVNHVYTPPEFRGRGYASNLVAAVTRRMLDGERRFCTLFTDLANPTSNKIYQRIGYRPVCDCAHWAFADGEEA